MEEPKGKATTVYLKEQSSTLGGEFNDEDKTAVMLMFEPGKFGDLGRNDRFYPSSLATDEKLSIFKGTLGYIDHPSPEKSNLERSIRDVAFTVLDAYSENGLPYAKVEFLGEKEYNLAKRLKNHIGPSLFGPADAIQTRVNGRKVNYVKDFRKGIRLDLVTAPGAGGRIVNIKESATGGEEFMDEITLEDLEANEKGKEVIAQIREAATADAKKEIDNIVNKAVADAIKAKDAEIIQLREAASTTEVSLEDQVSELTKLVGITQNALIQEQTARKVEVKLREAALPDDIANVVSGILTKLPEEDWDAIVGTYKGVPRSAGKVEGAGVTVNLREGQTTGLTADAIAQSGADFLGVSLEEYKSTPTRFMNLKM